MFYVYCEAGARALLTAAPDFISAQFFAVKYSLARPDTIAIYPAATGFDREPLLLFENGQTVVKPQGPRSAPAIPAPQS